MNDLNKIIATLEIDKCYTDKERAVKLNEEIARREFELIQIKAMYQSVYDYVVNEWYNEFAVRYPDLESQSFIHKNGIGVVIAIGESKYGILLGKNKNLLYSLLKIEDEDPKNDKHIIDKQALKYKDRMMWARKVMTVNRFGPCDFDAAFSDFCKIVEVYLKTQQKAASKVEGVE